MRCVQADSNKNQRIASGRDGSSRARRMARKSRRKESETRERRTLCSRECGIALAMDADRFSGEGDYN